MLLLEKKESLPTAQKSKYMLMHGRTLCFAGIYFISHPSGFGILYPENPDDDALIVRTSDKKTEYTISTPRFTIANILPLAFTPVPSAYDTLLQKLEGTEAGGWERINAGRLGKCAEFREYARKGKVEK